MRKLGFLVLFVVIFSICSCSVLDRNAKITYNEEELSLDDVTAIGDSFGSESEPDRSVVIETYSEDFVDTPVYWTESGGVWHTNPDCRYLRNVDRIVCGSEENAVDEGKSRLCSGCKGKD